MAEITAALVGKLRQATNVSMMECKKALVEADGDLDQATRILRERGIAVAVKKSSRAANQGLVASAATENGSACSLIEVNCETDFVTRNETFRTFVAELAEKACLTDQPLAEECKDLIVAKVAEIGENIVARRNTRYTLEDTGILSSYIHLGGKVGVIIDVACEKEETSNNDAFRELVKDLTLHIAACSPKYLTSNEVPQDVITSEREIYAKQVTNKPPQIVEKIVDGKIKKFFAESCLLDQGFVKEPKVSVTSLLTQKSKELDDTLSIRRYTRYQLGE
jgi:elongation factor Ts